MALCTPCSQIVTNKRSIPGHGALEYTGAGSGATPIGQARITVKLYKCLDCGTAWRHEDDRNDNQAGWSTVTSA